MKTIIPDKFTLTYKKVDMKPYVFFNIEECRIARLLKRYFPNAVVGIGGTKVYIDGLEFKILNDTGAINRVKDAKVGNTVSFKLNS